MAKRMSGVSTDPAWCICERSLKGPVLIQCKNKDCPSPWWHTTCAGIKGLKEETLKPLSYTCPLCVVTKGTLKEKIAKKSGIKKTNESEEKASGSEKVIGSEKASGRKESESKVGAAAKEDKTSMVELQEKKVDEANQVSIIDDKMETGEKLLLDFKTYFNEKFEKLHNEVVLLKQKGISEKFSFTGKSEEKVKKVEEREVVAEKPKPKPRRRPVALIVEEKEEEKFTEKTWSEVVRGKVSKKLVNVPVRSNKVSINGKGVITFDSESSRKIAQELLSKDYNVSVPEKILPKILIRHLDGFTKEDKINLQNKVLEKNEVISSFVDDGKVFEILFINEKAMTAVAKVSPEIKNYLSKKRYLNIDMRSHRVEAHFHVFQCFRCQKFGHKADSEQCPLKDSNDNVCLYCNEDHKSSECPFKKDKSKHKCSNCLEKGSKSHNHSSISNVCPFYLRALQAVKDNTLSFQQPQGN